MNQNNSNNNSDDRSFEEVLKEGVEEAGGAIAMVSEGFNFAADTAQQQQVIDALISLKDLTQTLIDTCYKLKPGLRPQ